jgi:hypothetical protein
LRVDTTENGNFPATTNNKKYKINKLVESYANKYPVKQGPGHIEGNNSKENIKAPEAQPASPQPKGYGSTELWHLVTVYNILFIN